MNKYLKNLKLKRGLLTVEFALILTFVISIGYFYLPGSGLGRYLDGVIDVVLGRVSSDTGDYSPSGMWYTPEPPAEEPPEIKEPVASGIVTEAVKEAFRGKDSKGDAILNNIIAVQIYESGKVQIQLNGNSQMETLEKYFTGNGSHIIMDIIKSKEGGDTVKPGIYKFEL